MDSLLNETGDTAGLLGGDPLPYFLELTVGSRTRRTAIEIIAKVEHQ